LETLPQGLMPYIALFGPQAELFAPPVPPFAKYSFTLSAGPLIRRRFEAPTPFETEGTEETETLGQATLLFLFFD